MSRSTDPLSPPSPIRFSPRSTFATGANRLWARAEELRRGGRPLVDLTDSNPTRCGLAWPAEELAAALRNGDVSDYQPDPRGLSSAREAVARYLEGRGARVSPDAIVLTASTSEAYSLLLKLLCDPGDEVLAPAPSYPLLDVLAQLECVRLVRYPLRYDGTWEMDMASVAAAVTERTRAIVVVSPSNPTGALLAPDVLVALEELCATRGLALIGDEVFADTAVTTAPSVASARRCLAFQVSGLSKVFLTPLRARLAQNEATLVRAAGPGAPFDVLRRCGGWTAVLRIGEARDEEQLCLSLLDAGVVVQPGFFYDFERPGYLVLSLLPPPEVFRRGVEILVERLGSFV